MSWKVFLGFIAGLAAIPGAIIAALTIDDAVTKRAAKKWWDENAPDGSCPLPACNGRAMCNRDHIEPCEVLLAIRDASYDQVYGDG